MRGADWNPEIEKRWFYLEVEISISVDAFDRCTVLFLTDHHTIFGTRGSDFEIIFSFISFFFVVVFVHEQTPLHGFVGELATWK